MPWSWSHTVAAYQNARENLDLRDRTWLETVFAEWVAIADHPDDTEHFDSKAYDRALKHARTLPEDILADHIYEKMEAQALCTNGGFQAWACPYGCVPHLVSFDNEAAEEDDEDEELDHGPISP